MECASCGVRSPGWETGSELRTVQTQPSGPRLALNEDAQGDLHAPARDSEQFDLADLVPSSPDAPRLRLDDADRQGSRTLSLAEPSLAALSPPTQDDARHFRLLIDG